MTSSDTILLTWHSKNHGIRVLHDTLDLLRDKGHRITKVFYLCPESDSFQPSGEPEEPRIELEVVRLKISDPSNHQEIYKAVSATIVPRVRDLPNLHINVSPGTPAMHCVWLILHAGGAFPKGTCLWSSQRPDPQGKTRLNRVDFGVSTYLAEIRVQARRNLGIAQYDPGNIQSEARRKAFEELIRFATSVPGAPLLILGERGTGKTRLVESLIPTLKKRPKVVAVPCGTLDSSIVESQLFGHVKGAFTGAEKDRLGFLGEADEGILFLDEIQDLPLSVQRKLVRLLQDRKRRYRQVGADEERSVDVEVVCASNLPLDKLAERLVPDFFDRISHYLVTIPPLRKCREDLPTDWENVWKETCTDIELPDSPPNNDAVMDALASDPLPGNLRDLQRLAYHIAAWWHHHTPDDACKRALRSWRRPITTHSDSEDLWGTGSRDDRIRNFQRLLARRFKAEYGTWTAAAKALGCHEKTLREDAK